MPLAGVAVIKVPHGFNDRLLVGTPSRVSPLWIHEEELFLLQAVTDQPLPRARRLAARVTARGQCHLEEDTLQIGTEHRKEDGWRTIAESLRIPVGIGRLQRIHLEHRVLLSA